MITEPSDDMIPEIITCIDCGGRCHLLTTVTPEQPLYPGDVATYRCEDCRDRWDLVVPDDDGYGDGGRAEQSGW
jgi:hypothetical protein